MKTSLQKVSFIDYSSLLNEEVNPYIIVLMLQVGIVQMFLSDADAVKLDVVTTGVR